MFIIKTVLFEIHGIDWKVNIFDKEDDEVIVGEVGECDYLSYEIDIVGGLTESQFRSVLTHEMAHAFRWTYGLVSEREKITIPTMEIEEIVANSIETFARDILERVDVIVDFIYKKPEKEKKQKKNSKEA